MDEMYAWMKSISDRISALESKSTSTSKPESTQGFRKLEAVKSRTVKFMAERKTILAFNEVQRKKIDAKDPSDKPISWKNDKGVVYHSVLDTNGLDALVRSKKGPLWTFSECF